MGRHREEAVRERSFSAFTAIIWAISIAAAATVLVSVLLLLVSVRRADRLALERQQSLVTAALAQSVTQVAHDQESATIWTEAARAVRRPRPDLDWIDQNLGLWFHDYFGHDEVFLLNPAGRPIYGMRAGRRAAPAAFYDYLAAAAMPLVRDLQGQRRTEGKRAGTFLSPGSADFRVIAGHPAIVSVKPILPERGSREPGLDAGFMHVSVVYLDKAFARTLSRDFDIQHPAFVQVPARDQPAIPLRSKDGRVVSHIVWSPFQPGTLVSRRIIPVMAFAAFLVGGIILFLARHLRARTLQLHASEAQAQYLAGHDPLTGLPNRGLFQDRVRQELARLRGEGGRIAYLCLDLNGFKDVNDTFGHPTGDELIRTVAAEIGAVLGAEETLARIGGDMFAILQVCNRGPADAEALCRRLAALFADPFRVGETTLSIGVSIGIALGSGEAADATELARKADVAMYEAKGAGGGWAFFSPAMDASRRGRREMEVNLRAALQDDDQLTVQYQPTFAARTLRITGVEALVRWRHPALGWIDPTSFIPVAEETGLIEELGLRVLRQACAAARNWPIASMAVNVSPVQLRSSHFADDVLAVLAETGLPAERLEIEITETTFLDNAAACRANLRRLREAGVSIALDDFGTGYSSFSHLNELLVDKIKIDRSFVAASGPGGEGQAIVRWIVNMARASGLKVTAEGVETEAQQIFLSRIGCTALQGFLLAGPMTDKEVSQLLTSREGEARGTARRKANAPQAIG